MASVQELIAALQYRNGGNQPSLVSELSDIAKTVGYGEDIQTQQLARQHAIVQMQQEQADRARREEAQAQLRAELAGATEARNREAMRGVGSGPAPVLPGMKLQAEYDTDASGNITKKFKSADPSASGFRPEPYLDPVSKKNRIGRFDPSTGKTITSPEDPFSPESSKVEVGEKDKQFLQRQWVALGKEANLQKASSRSPLGLAVVNNMKAGRGIRLLDSDSVYTPQDESLVTTDLTAIMKGGSPDEELLRQQQYGSWQKKGVELLQKIQGAPKMLNDPQTRQHLREVIQGIREVDNDAIKNHFDSLESTYMDAVAARPKEWEAYKAKQLKFIGLNPDAGTVGAAAQAPAAAAPSGWRIVR